MRSLPPPSSGALVPEFAFFQTNSPSLALKQNDVPSRQVRKTSSPSITGAEITSDVRSASQKCLPVLRSAHKSRWLAFEGGSDGLEPFDPDVVGLLSFSGAWAWLLSKYCAWFPPCLPPAGWAMNNFP